MANVASCALAIEKDEKKLKMLGLVRHRGKGGFYHRRTYKTAGGVHEVVVAEVKVGEKFERTILVDGVERDHEPFGPIDWKTYKVICDLVDSNGWRLDCLTLGLASYQLPVNIREYDDHITVYFGGRWNFPQELIEKLESSDLLWQGAEAEIGCSILNDELGNEDFGLRAITEKDEDEWDASWVEDTTTLSTNEKGDN